MKNRKVPGVRKVSGKELRDLSMLAWVRDDALSDRTLEARLLPDGRVLLYLAGDGDRATLYPSRASLEQLQRRGDEELAKGPVDLTQTLLPPIAAFIRDAETHAASLGRVLHIPDEVLDRSEASLDAVDDALRRIRPAAKRMTPQIVTPLFAYVGEVIRHACGGRWTPGPTTRTRRVPIYDPAELAAWRTLSGAEVQAASEAQEEAAAAGASPMAVTKPLRDLARSPKLLLSSPKPIRFEEIEEPIPQDNCPMITARDGRLLSPFRLVIEPLVEPSKRVALRSGVDVMTMGYRSRTSRGLATR